MDAVQHGLAGDAECNGSDFEWEPALGRGGDDPIRTAWLMETRQGAPGARCSPTRKPALQARAASPDWLTTCMARRAVRQVCVTVPVRCRR